MPAEEGKKPEETKEAVEPRSFRDPQESQTTKESQEAERSCTCHAVLSFLASSNWYPEHIRDVLLNEPQPAIVPRWPTRFNRERPLAP